MPLTYITKPNSHTYHLPLPEYLNTVHYLVAICTPPMSRVNAQFKEDHSFLLSLLHQPLDKETQQRSLVYQGRCTASFTDVAEVERSEVHSPITC